MEGRSVRGRGGVMPGGGTRESQLENQLVISSKFEPNIGNVFEILKREPCCYQHHRCIALRHWESVATRLSITG